MKKKKETFKEKWKNKSLFSKISDFIFLALLIAMFIPQSRMAIGAFVNGIKAKIIQPAVVSNENAEKLSETDFNVKMTATSGESIKLSDFKGKVIFLNIWATWCPPCVGEMPGIQKLYDKFKDKNDIKFIMLSAEDFGKIKPFIETKGYSFPVYSMETQLPELLSTSGIPATFLISKDGKIVLKEVGAANWGGDKMTNIIKELLK